MHYDVIWTDFKILKVHNTVNAMENIWVVLNKSNFFLKTKLYNLLYPKYDFPTTVKPLYLTT